MKVRGEFRHSCCRISTEGLFIWCRATPNKKYVALDAIIIKAVYCMNFTFVAGIVFLTWRNCNSLPDEA